MKRLRSVVLATCSAFVGVAWFGCATNAPPNANAIAASVNEKPQSPINVAEAKPSLLTPEDRVHIRKGKVSGREFQAVCQLANYLKKERNGSLYLEIGGVETKENGTVVLGANISPVSLEGEPGYCPGSTSLWEVRATGEVVCVMPGA